MLSTLFTLWVTIENNTSIRNVPVDNSWKCICVSLMLQNDNGMDLGVIMNVYASALSMLANKTFSPGLNAGMPKYGQLAHLKASPK